MSDQGVSIRSCSIEDAAALAGLTEQLGYPTSATQMQERLDEIMLRPDRATLVAERGGRVVGYAGAWCGSSYEADRPHARLLVIVVDEHSRRSGIASRLANAIEAWARQRGAAYVVLGSGHHRAKAHDFYERIGYRHTGRRYVKTLDPASVTHAGASSDVDRQ